MPNISGRGLGSLDAFSAVKVGLSTSKNICFVFFSESSLKTMKNAFYFIWKALFVLRIFKFLLWYFGHIEKAAWLERQIEFMMSQPGKLLITIHISYCSMCYKVKAIIQWNLVSW